MTLKSFFSRLRAWDECAKVGIPLWQCPHFLFLLMGSLIIIAILSTYVVGVRLVDDPYLLNMIILSLTGVLLVLSYTITRSFDRLAEANRMKSEFVSIVSHQLRAPLTNFQWALDFLMSEQKQDQTSKEKGYFRILHANTDRMQDLVNGLLTVSRIQEGRLPIYKKPFDFPELISAVASEFNPLLYASNIDFIIEGDERISTIEADPAKIRDVITNLIDNAVKYTKRAIESGAYAKARGKIIVRYKKKGKTLHFSVEDNGIGIPKGDEKYIFRKFFRSANVLKHQTQGSGLGLYIARSIVENSGGEMGFSSEENKGSTFWFTLPLTK